MPLWRRCLAPAVANGVGEELRSTFTSTVGGVMTEEAGAITGDLELLTHPTSEAGDAQLEVLVRYAGAGEWYTVSGSPLAKPAGEEDHRASHEEALTRLTTPGPVQGGNELPVDLRGW
jgi:hypothetical protein